MVNRNPPPYFPLPPREYEQSYFTRLVQAFANYLQLQEASGEARATFIVLTHLQEHDQGLEPGALFQQDGFVKITRESAPHVAGVSATTQLGSVTVTTT